MYLEAGGCDTAWIPAPVSHFVTHSLVAGSTAERHTMAAAGSGARVLPQLMGKGAYRLKMLSVKTWLAGHRRWPARTAFLPHPPPKALSSPHTALTMPSMPRWQLGDSSTSSTFQACTGKTVKHRVLATPKIPGKASQARGQQGPSPSVHLPPPFGFLGAFLCCLPAAAPGLGLGAGGSVACRWCAMAASGSAL